MYTSTKNHKTNSGFTLIELLIVVAIIAILAAIAVPNFLEAQVRAKVSRIKSDMRSCATAMEAYRIDNNNYILTSGQIRLTTPIAYITSWPKSPFREPAFSGPRPFARWEALSSVGPTFIVTTDTSEFFEPFANDDNSPLITGARGVEEAFGGTPINPVGGICERCEDNDYILYGTFELPSDSTSVNNPALYTQYEDTTRWSFKSGGPDADDDLDALNNNIPGNGTELYDPTNGTVSSGDILMWGPGLGFNDGR